MSTESENDIVNPEPETSQNKPAMIYAQNLASKSARLSNLILDTLLIYLLYYGVLSLVLSTDLILTYEKSRLFRWLLWASTYMLYYIVLEGLFQRSPAKFVTGTIVVNRDGSKPSTGMIVARSLARFIPLEAFTFLGKNSYGIHDSISRTFVIYKS